MGVTKISILVLAATSACSEKTNQCGTDSDCKDIAYPFCDVNGQFSPSGGEMHVCTIVPPDCPVERCGCTPGATTCSGDQLSICNIDGMSASTTSCALGCAASSDRCTTFTPSNGLDAPLVAASAEPDVVLPASVQINTDNGEVRDSTNHLVTVTSLVVHQNSGDIRAFVGKSFEISNATMTGKLAAAFVAPGKVVVKGAVHANGMGALGGPGAATTDCVGAFTTAGGGGGNSTPGGDGLTPLLFGTQVSGLIVKGGVEQSGSVLRGGCLGGDATNGGGGGGGAVQIDSLAEVDIAASAEIDVGGGGGRNHAGGGGAGGFVILEAPAVHIAGNIYANGGGGAACDHLGQDANASIVPAAGATCTATTYAGAGAVLGAAPGNATLVEFYDVGGGGALGRLLVRDQGGMPATEGASVVSAGFSVEALTLH